MSAKHIAVAGIALVFAGLLVLAFFRQFDTPELTQSSILERTVVVPSSVCWQGACQSGFTTRAYTETVELKLPRRLATSDSTAVEFYYTALSGDSKENEALNEVIKAQAYSSGFDIAPSEVISKTLYNGQPIRFVWIISPKRTGNHNISLSFTGVSQKALANMQAGVTFDDAKDQGSKGPTMTRLAVGDVTSEEEPLIYDIQVVDTLGIPSRLGTVLGYVASFGGTALTIPWWYERWEKWREQSRKQPEQQQQPSTSRSKKKRKR